jgi:hypothetical protein
VYAKYNLYNIKTQKMISCESKLYFLNFL